jgi:hypothetical protein
MNVPKWSLFVFPILAFTLMCMFPIPAMVVTGLVATCAVIAAQRAAATKPHHRQARELGGAGGWIAPLAACCVAIGMALAIVCVLLSPAE